MRKVWIFPVRLLRHLFDVHAAFGGGDEGDARGLAVDQRGKIKLARDVGAFLDIKPAHHAPLRPGLMGDQRHAQHAGGFALHVVDGAHDLDAAALAAPAGMDLRLDHPDRSAQFLGRRDGFIDREGGFAARRGGAEAAQNLFRLIFVDVHEKSEPVKEKNDPNSRSPPATACPVRQPARFRRMRGYKSGAASLAVERSARPRGCPTAGRRPSSGP